MRCFICVCCATIVSFATVAAGADWNETINGDLSGDINNPTPVTFDLGENRIIGTMGTPQGGNTDADIFTFTLAPGLQLTSIFVESITVPDEGSFYAIASGTIITSDPGEHLSNILITGPGEYFDDLASPIYGGPGIHAPLGPGAYTVWWQETAVSRDYTMRYTVTEIPEPGAAMLALVAGAALLRRKSRRA